MNFFNSVFSDEPDPQPHASESEEPNPVPTTGAWSFGDLIQTLASKSESVIENYRRDLEEFSSGLKKETSVIREAASRAVKDLPASLDAGASVAQESLETVGQAIDDIGTSVWKSTAQIISHGRESLLSPDLDPEYSFDSDGNIVNAKRELIGSGSVGSDLKRYSRFDMLVRALQSDVSTYLEEPEDEGNYSEWKLGFKLDEKGEEIGNLIEENGVVEEIYGNVVPSRIDHERFWTRYFYRLHKLKEAEEARAELVKRAISGNEEEDLSWDFDDDDDGYEMKGSSSGVGGGVENVGSGKEDLKIESDGKGVAPESKQDGGEKLVEEKHDENVVSDVAATVSGSGDDKVDVKCEEKEASELKTDNDSGGSCKDSDISVVSTQPSMPEDIGWDEIEDVESNDENKADGVGSTSRIDLRKRLSAAEQDEDLSWDIEDDDDDEAGKS